MTQKDKELLLKDLCGRLPYGVKVTWDGKHPLTVTPHIYCAIASEDKIDNLPKLLLRPLSSMTEEEKEELIKNFWGSHTAKDTFEELSWYFSKHFDINGLIPKGLAIEVTEDNNPYKE